MNEEKANSPKGGADSLEESLLDLLRRCPIDEETWTIILDRPNDPQREISFEDWNFEDGDAAAECVESSEGGGREAGES